MLSASGDAVRAMEQKLIMSGVDEYTLMCRAGTGAAAWIDRAFPDARRIAVLCGKGNNGGDALVAAAKLHNRDIVIYSTAAADEFSGCAASAMRDLPKSIPFFHKECLSEHDLRNCDLIIDGLLGTGFSGTMLRENVRSFISAANLSNVPIISLDLPSGIDCSSGTAASNGAVNAFCTLTFGVPKKGLFRGEGSSLRGMLRVIDIGLDTADADGREVFTNIDAIRSVWRFDANCHKNSRGRVLVWGGSEEYRGAAALCAVSAAYAGAGMVRLASEADMTGRIPMSLICKKLDKNSIPKDFMAKSDVLVCGCGWGRCVSADSIDAALDFNGKLILDADALNFIANDPSCWRRRSDVIITPHYGEASRLADGFGIKFSTRDDLAAALAETLGVVTVLKGRDTVVAAPKMPSVIISSGNSLLATAGSGDVLAGVIGTAAALKTDVFEAALLGAYIHGVSAESSKKIIIADDIPILVADAVFRLQHALFI